MVVDVVSDACAVVECGVSYEFRVGAVPVSAVCGLHEKVPKPVDLMDVTREDESLLAWSEIVPSGSLPRIISNCLTFRVIEFEHDRDRAAVAVDE
jgi:hypothetical protein